MTEPSSTDETTGRRVVHDEAHRTYRLFAGDVELSHVDYRELTDETGRTTLVFHHTFTIPRHRGNGFADEVVRAALDDVAARGLTVVPRCWVVADVIADTPAYASLLA